MIEYKDLLPCPFCGFSDADYKVNKGDAWYECIECEAQGPHSHLAYHDKADAMAEARELWNTRND